MIGAWEADLESGGAGAPPPARPAHGSSTPLSNAQREAHRPFRIFLLIRGFGRLLLRAGSASVLAAYGMVALLLQSTRVVGGVIFDVATTSGTLTPCDHRFTALCIAGSLSMIQIE